MISGQCPECQGDVISNKRGCGSPVSTGGRAHSPFFFTVRTKESNTCPSFCANAWICACQATDRDIESQRHEKVSAWKSTRQATDRDIESSSTMKKVNAWICALLTTDHDPASVIPENKRKSVMFVILCGHFFWELRSPVTFFCKLFFLTKWFLN